MPILTISIRCGQRTVTCIFCGKK